MIEEIILTDSGKRIMEYYSLNENLDKFNREALVMIIIQKCFKDNFFPTTKQLFKIADDICKIFPNEPRVI